MKRFLFICSFLVAFMPVMGDDYVYPYLIFTGADGAQTTVSVASLEIVFADGQLVATNGDGTTTLTLADLASMTFSATGELSPIDPIKAESGLALAGDGSELTATLGEEFTEPEITNPNNLTLTWTSSDESVATVDEQGHVTLVGAGTTTITATFAGNEEYKPGSAAYSLTVSEPEEDAIRDLVATTAVKAYTASGIYVGTFESMEQAKATLKKGLYVVSAGNKNYKLNIR